MGFIAKYPYTDFHELNLDYLLQVIKSVEITLKDFVSLNAIKYADPIQWSITRQYEKNTVVIDPLTGTAYISVAPVPIGAALTRPEYWTVVFDLEQFVTKASENFANTYEAQTTTTATQATPQYGWIVWGGILYVANTNITPGDAYVVDGNITRITVEDICGHIQTLNTTDKSNLVAAVNEVLATLISTAGDLNSLTTTDKSNLVAAINEVITTFDAAVLDIQTDIGDLATLATTDKTSLVNAINEVLATLAADVIALEGITGDLANLTTTDKTSLVNAINEVLATLVADVSAINGVTGDLANLNTSDKTSLVNAINEVLASINNTFNTIMLNIEDYKTPINTYVDAFEAAYQDLPLYGGIIYIPNSITIDRSIDLVECCNNYGIKKVMIRGNYGNLNNPGTNYNSIIIKNGDFDAVILANGCSMDHIGVSSTGTFVDTHDGIWVWGITCSLSNVGVCDQGGNGIHVGNKSAFAAHNCNIVSVNTVRSVHNKGWGLVIEDQLHATPNTYDANAGVYVALDIRDNDAGGIYINNCMDNWFYSPDVEVNDGEAGIKIDNAQGIHVYSCYEENNTTYGILLTSNSSRCIIMGYRAGTIDSLITDNGTSNYVLAYQGSKFSVPYLSSPIAMRGTKLANPDSNGFFDMYVSGYDLFIKSAYMGNLKIVNINGDPDYIYAKNVSESPAKTDIISTADFTVGNQSASYYRRKGNMVTLNLYGTPLTSSSITLLTLPAALAPMEPIYTYSISQGNHAVLLMILTDGTVSLYGPANELVITSVTFSIA